MLKTWDDKYFRRRFTKDTAEARAEYYHRAFQFLHSHTFKSPIERAVWAMHAEGSSFRDIEAKHGINKDKVNTIVNKLVEVCFGSRTKKG